MEINKADCVVIKLDASCLFVVNQGNVSGKFLVERKGNEVWFSGQLSPDKKSALKKVVGACIFHQVLTALFTPVSHFFDIFFFLMAHQTSRQATREKPVCCVMPPKHAFSIPDILWDPITKNTICGKPITFRVWVSQLLICLLSFHGYLSVPGSSGRGHSCSGGFQSDSCLNRTLSHPASASNELQKKKRVDRVLKALSLFLHQTDLSQYFLYVCYYLELLKIWSDSHAFLCDTSLNIFGPHHQV